MAPAPARPLLLNQLGGPVAAALNEYAEQVDIITGERESTAPWVTHGADILLTGPSRSWATAPTNPPPEWGDGPKWVQIASAGIDSYPHWLTHGRLVTCGRGDAATPIAEYVLSAMLQHERQVDAFRPTSPTTWDAFLAPLRQAPVTGTLNGKTLGLAGYGAIGHAIAHRARAFGMQVHAFKRSPWQTQPEGLNTAPTLASLFERADHLVLAMPLTPETRGIITTDILRHARPNLHLINVARGALINQNALLAALDAGRPAFATLDVTTPEPLPTGHPFYTHPNIRLTPHISWVGPDVRHNLVQRIRTNLSRYLSGQPLLDTIDATRGY